MNTELSQTLLDKLRSQEEKQVAFWLREAVEAKLISGFDYECDKFELFPKTVVRCDSIQHTKDVKGGRFVHAAESYTPDYRIVLTELGESVLMPLFPKACAVRKSELVARDLFFDVKGGYNPYQTDERYFSLVRKAVLARHGIWVEKVIPYQKKKGVASGLFVDTWCPEPYRWMKKRKEPTLTAVGAASRSIDAFLLKRGAKVGADGEAHVEVQKELF